MNNDPSSAQRRVLLQIATGIAASAMSGAVSAGAVLAPAPTGKAGDFDFLSGNWKIRHQRLKDGQWDAFEGEATVHGLLGGIASVEELRIPSRGMSGMGMRVLDVERKRWADYWVNSQSGIVAPAPAWGSFVDGVGHWDSTEVDDGKAVIVRGTWDQITPHACQWRQARSEDEGRTWQENWRMQWRRVPA